MKRLLSVFLSIVMVTSILAPFNVVADKYTDTDIKHAVVHDPSIIKANDGKYYVVGSHLAMYESDDLINWNKLDSSIDSSDYLGENWKETLAEPLKWTTAWQEWRRENDPAYQEADIEYNCWANDIIYNEYMGKYCLYGAVSVWGSTCSAIWLCTSDNIDGPYEYVHTFIYSGITKNTSPINPKYNALPYTNSNIPKDLIDTKIVSDEKEILKQPWFIQDAKDPNYGHYDCGLGKYPNAIDPTPFIDKNGDMWLVYGSYSGGCFVIKLNNETGLPDYNYMKNTSGYDMYFGKKISNTNEATEGTGEGPYIQYDPVSDYYYFYLTYGGLYYGGGYNIREYRSKNPDGPYVDAAGNLATDMKNTGLKLDGNYKLSGSKSGYLSGGHGSCLVDDDNSMYHSYHTRYLPYKNDEPLYDSPFWDEFQTVTHKMVRTSNGWSVFLPFQYQGEKDITSIHIHDVVGEYEFVDTTDGIQNLSYGKDLYDTIYPTQKIVLNEDGTISNIKHYDFVTKTIKVDDREERVKEYVAKNVSGTWSLKNGTVNVSFKIGDVSYEGVFAKQYDETANKNEVIVFTAAGDNNTSIWGVKDHIHNFIKDVTISPTCTAKGYTTYACKVCKYSYKGNYKNATSHKVVTDKAGAPTCTKAGKTAGSHCSVCKAVIKKQSVVKAKGHSYDTGKVTTKPTDKKTGVLTYTCKSCKAKKTEKLAKLTNVSGVKVSGAKKALNVSWKKNTKMTGYEIQYSTDKNFKKAKTVKVMKNSTTKTTIKKLSSKKYYYVRVRTYKTINGTSCPASWSKAIKVKTK